MELSDLIRTLEAIAPPALTDPMDVGKTGLIVPGRREVTKVATALDATLYAIKRASEIQAQALIVHHTLIWNPVTVIDEGLARALKLLLESRISLYAMHTNYDQAPGGVNDTLAEIVGLKEVSPCGLARVGRVSLQSMGTFAAAASRELGTDVEVVGPLDKEVGRVVVAAGSAFREALPLAKGIKADALLSSELRHDVIRDRGDIALISAPHYYTEAPAMKRLAGRLNKTVPAEFIEDRPIIRVIRA